MQFLSICSQKVTPQHFCHTKYRIALESFDTLETVKVFAVLAKVFQREIEVFRNPLLWEQCVLVCVFYKKNRVSLYYSILQNKRDIMLTFRLEGQTVSRIFHIRPLAHQNLASKVIVDLTCGGPTNSRGEFLQMSSQYCRSSSRYQFCIQVSIK